MHNALYCLHTLIFIKIWFFKIEFSYKIGMKIFDCTYIVGDLFTVKVGKIVFRNTYLFEMNKIYSLNKVELNFIFWWIEMNWMDFL